MAKKSKRGRRRINRSNLVREYLASPHGKLGPRALARLIKEERKVTVSPALVGNLKYRTAKEKTGKKVNAAAANGAYTLDALLQAKEFADKVGGLEHAQGALAALAQLR